MKEYERTIELDTLCENMSQWSDDSDFISNTDL
jgi:hypothetical protein